MIQRTWSSTWVLLAFSIVVAGAFACTKPELIGSDLLQNEASEVGFTDTVTLQCGLEVEDGVITWSADNGRQITRNLLGHLNDPFFGQSDASIYAQVFLLTGSSGFLGRVIDSVVLALRYDTVGLYGDIAQPVTLSAYLMQEEFDPEVDILSNYEPMIAPDPVASITFTPAPFDSIDIQARGDSARVPPMVRMNMSQEFIQSMMSQDSSTFESEDSFRTWIKGLHLDLSQAENTMLSFDLRSTYSKMTVYYQNTVDTFSSEVSFIFTDVLGSGIHHAYFSNDYTGSEAQKFLDNQSLADSLLFVQGMSGLNTTVSFPGLQNIDNILINKAELEFYVADLPGNDLDLYPLTPQLINAVEDDDGKLVFSEDVNLALRQFGQISVYGGGLSESDTTSTSPRKYVMNVTTSLQDIYKGKTDNLYFITPFLKPNVPNRVILYGPGHPTYPARLRLTYTVVQ